MPRFGSKKSHLGCERCKERKVKCDEEAPCRNCLRRGEPCSLTSTPPARASVNNAAPGAELIPTGEWMQDMELMFHYTNHVAHTPFGARKEVQDLFKTFIPQEATKFKFLLHSILALSALNLALLRQSQAAEYLSVCDRHQSAALSGFRSTLSGEITFEIGNALFACATTISLSSKARSCATAAIMPEPKHLNMEDITQSFLLSRGVREVMGVAREAVYQGPLKHIWLVNDTTIIQNDTKTSTDMVNNRFRELEGLLKEQCPTNTDLTETLEHLRDVYDGIQVSHASSDLVDATLIWRWPVVIPIEYVHLIRAQDPVALIILAHFASATTATKTWYTEGWADYCLMGITQCLPDDLQHWLRWPLEQDWIHETVPPTATV